MEFDFPWPSTAVPAFVQIKGVRFKLPQAQPVSALEYENGLGGASETQVAAGSTGTQFVAGGAMTRSDIQVSNTLRPVNANKNQLPGTIRANADSYLVEGFADFPRGGIPAARTLRLKGFYEPEGTMIVQLTVRRGGVVDIFDPALRAQAGDNAAPALVDSQGMTYSAIGFLYDLGDKVRVSMLPRKRIRTIADLPQLSQTGGRTLRVIFRVTEGVQLVGLRLGDIDVASCNLTVTSRR